MKFTCTLCKGIAFAVLLPGTAAFAQELSLSDALSGTNLPLSMKAIDIPDDFRAVKITQPNSGDAIGLGSMMPTLIAVGAVNNLGAPGAMFIEILPISWTKGDIVKIMGQDYIVTYGIELGPTTLRGMSGSKKLPAFSLKLKLLKTSDIGSIVPLPEWTKDKYLRAMSQVSTIATIASAPATKRVAMRTPVEQAPTTTTPTSAEVIQTTESTTTTTTRVPATKTAVTTPAPVTTGETAVKGLTVQRPIDANLYDSATQNAKSVASAMLLYAQDYNETFPYVQGSKGAEYVIYPYVKNIQVYQTLNPVRSGDFRFNMSLAGVPMSELAEPANTPLFYDPFAWPNNTYLVAFADSHVRFLTADEWQAAKRNLALKLKRVGNPLPATLALPNSITGGSTSGGSPAPTTNLTTIPPTGSGGGGTH